MGNSPYHVPPPELAGDADAAFRRKVDHMLAEFTARGLNAYTVAPPLYRLAWAVGWKLVPPLFAEFWKTAAFLGAAWGIGWGLLMSVLLPLVEGGDADTGELVRLGRLGSVFFGLATAGYYLWLRRQYGLPAWANYPAGAADARQEGDRRAVRAAQEDDVPEVIPAEGEPRLERQWEEPRQRRRAEEPAGRRAGSAGDIRRWLAGSWQGTVVLRGQGQEHQVPYTQHFDAEGRPYLELAAGGPTLITHVGQAIQAGKTVFTVRELTWAAEGCRVVLEMLRESFQQYAGVWGPGVAAASDSSTSTAYTVFEFVRQGDALVMQMASRSQTSTSMRVLDGGSTGHESAETSLAGLLHRA